MVQAEIITNTSGESRTEYDVQYCAKLTLKSNRASIWFWMIGMVLRSFSVFMVLITPSTLKENISTHYFSGLPWEFNHTEPLAKWLLPYSFKHFIMVWKKMYLEILRFVRAHGFTDVFKIPDWMSYPRFTFVKSNATCRYDTAFSFRYRLYRRINVDMS